MNNIIDDKNFKHIRFDTSENDNNIDPEQINNMSNDDFDLISPKSDTCDIPNLKDKSIYQSEIDVCIASILNTYVIMCKTFLNEVFDHISFLDTEIQTQSQSQSYSHSQTQTYIPKNMKVYIILKGLDLIKVVFTTVMLYTRNLLVTCQTTRHAMTLYFEFISQINSHNYEYLQLSVRDTTLFVYKKTIFNIDIETKNEFVAETKDNSYHMCIRSFAELITNITNDYIYEYDNPNKITSNILQLKQCLTGVNSQFSKILVMDIYDEDIISIVKNTTVINEKIDLLLRDSQSEGLCNVSDKTQILINILSFLKYKIKKFCNNINNTHSGVATIEHQQPDILTCNELIQRIFSNYEKLSNDKVISNYNSTTLVDYITKMLVKKT